MTGNGKIRAGNDWTMAGNVKVIMRGNMGKGSGHCKSGDNMTKGCQKDAKQTSMNVR
jgi:hypothetical protein